MLDVLRHTCPFPTIDAQGGLHDGLLIGQAKRCTRCETRSCKHRLTEKEGTAPRHDVCEFGFSTVVVPTSFGNLLLNGLFVPFHNEKMDPALRKSNRPQKVAWDRIEKYASTVRQCEPLIEHELDNRVAESVAGLHDIKTAVSLVLRNAEAIVRNLPGDYLVEKIDGADPELKSLLKSVALLNSRLALASIVANPEAAKHGRPRPTPIFKVFHRMVRLFEEQASRHRVALRMAGSSFNAPVLYDSFETIPLVLIDNAVKYSLPDTEAVVIVDDEGSGCSVRVQSRGKVIPDTERPFIFQKGFRSQQAIDTVSSGSGLGLYIAKTVADANQCQIAYDAGPFRHTDGTGVNVFSFSVRSIQ